MPGRPDGPAARYGLSHGLEFSMTMHAPQDSVLDADGIVALAEHALADIARVKESVGRVIFGQESVV